MPEKTNLFATLNTNEKGAMKGGRGTCGTFKVFNLTYHARTTFIEIYNLHRPELKVRACTSIITTK